MATEPSRQALNAARNKQIDEYYKAALQGVLSSGAPMTNALLVEKAMGVALAAYRLRCEVLGATFSKTGYDD